MCKTARQIAACTFILAVLLTGLTPLAACPSLPSSWAAHEIELAAQWGLLDARGGAPAGLLDAVESYTGGISKDTFCAILINLCEKLCGTPPEFDPAVRFDDPDAPTYFYQAYHAGIISGKGIDAEGRVILGRFDPLSRQEIGKMLYHAIAYCRPEQALAQDDAAAILSAFSDAHTIGAWAELPLAYMAARGIVKGDGGQILPLARSSVEQGILMANRSYAMLADEQVLSCAPLYAVDQQAVSFTSHTSGCGVYASGGLSVRWQPAGMAAGYLVKSLIGDRLSSRVTREPQLWVQESELTPGSALFSVAAVGTDGAVISRPASLALTILQKPRLEDQTFSFSSYEEGLAYMRTVTVKVWRLGADGKKYSDTTQIQVHRFVADDVVAIFDDIFNGSEQFPVLWVGGYAWRNNAKSEHQMGTAVDINPDQNYQIFPDGRIGAGKFWKPYENPYSIKPDGDVVRAFRARGWGWGGTDWKSNSDYMHFSYFGR